MNVADLMHGLPIAAVQLSTVVAGITGGIVGAVITWFLPMPSFRMIRENRRKGPVYAVSTASKNQAVQDVVDQAALEEFPELAHK